MSIKFYDIIRVKLAWKNFLENHIFVDFVVFFT